VSGQRFLIVANLHRSALDHVSVLIPQEAQRFLRLEGDAPPSLVERLSPWQPAPAVTVEPDGCMVARFTGIAPLTACYLEFQASSPFHP
jgi:hypothetical protein